MPLGVPPGPGTSSDGSLIQWLIVALDLQLISDILYRLDFLDKTGTPRRMGEVSASPGRTSRAAGRVDRVKKFHEISRLPPVSVLRRIYVDST